MIDQPQESTFNVIYGYRCNYSCQGCCVGSNYVKDYSSDPDLDLTLDAIDRLPGLVRIKDSDDYWQRGIITLLGGEPMMYWKERIVPLARQIRKNFPRVRLNIFSNGHLLHKHADEIFEFIDEVSANITISQHLIGDLNSTLGTHWKENINQFLNHSRLIKIHDEHYHLTNNLYSNIHLHTGKTWFSWYQTNHSKQIKPYASKDPAKSVVYGCASGLTCSSLFENKLYKCSSLAMLPGLLKYLNQEHDPAWQPYLDYPYIDVLEVDQTKLENFYQTYGKPTGHCTMCNDQPQNIIRWNARKQNEIMTS